MVYIYFLKYKPKLKGGGGRVSPCFSRDFAHYPMGIPTKNLSYLGNLSLESSWTYFSQALLSEAVSFENSIPVYLGGNPITNYETAS